MRLIMIVSAASTALLRLFFMFATAAMCCAWQSEHAGPSTGIGTLDGSQLEGGVLLRAVPVGGVEAKIPSSGHTRMIVPPRADALPIAGISGPDRSGMAFIIRRRVFNLEFSSLDTGSAEEKPLLTLHGTAESRLLGQSVALSSDGKRVAYIRDLAGLQMRAPDAYFSIGSLRVLEIATGAETTITEGVLGDTLAWCQDDRVIACIKFVPRNDPITKTLLRSPGEERFGKEWASWDKVPCVVLCPIAETELASPPLHLARRVVAYPGGGKLIVSDDEMRCRQIDLKSKEVVDLDPPKGMTYPGIIGFVSPLEVLVWSRPINAEVETEVARELPLGGRKAHRIIRLWNVDTGNVAEVMSHVDPAAHISVGLVSTNHQVK